MQIGHLNTVYSVQLSVGTIYKNWECELAERPFKYSTAYSVQFSGRTIDMNWELMLSTPSTCQSLQ